MSRATFLGLRLGAAFNTQRILTTDPDQVTINNEEGANSALSVGLAIDYYFYQSRLSPYLGIGLIHNSLNTSKTAFLSNDRFTDFGLSVGNHIGFLVRGGIDLSKFVLGVEFNFIPKANVTAPDEQVVGSIAMSNVALSVGRVFGGF